MFDVGLSVFGLGFMYGMGMDGLFGSGMDKPGKGFGRFGIGGWIRERWVYVSSKYVGQYLYNIFMVVLVNKNKTLARQGGHIDSS